MYGDFMYFDFDENCKTALDCQCPFIGPCDVGCKKGKCIYDSAGSTKGILKHGGTATGTDLEAMIMQRLSKLYWPKLSHARKRLV